MSEETDKSEKASPYKLREAKKKGQVAKSQELNHVVTLIVFTLVGSAFWNNISSGFSKLVENIWLTGNQVIFDKGPMLIWFSNIVAEMVGILGPLVAVIMLSGILANLIQTGLIVSTHSLKIDFSRLNPAKGLKKIFSIQKIFDLVKNVLKVCFIGGLFYLGVTWLLPNLVATKGLSPDAIGEYIIDYVVIVGLSVIAVLIPATIVDVIFSNKEFAKKMRMSKREVKEEHKRQEGSPEIKAKRKEAQKELLKKSAGLSKVQEADLIIVNPTRVAVGLKYDRKLMAAPMVIVKGKGELAKKIRELAQQYNKVFFTRPETARALYKTCEVDQAVAADLYTDVAEIYRTFYSDKEAR